MVDVAGFFYNLAESLKMNDESPLLKEIVELATLITPSLQWHNDNKEDAKGEATNYFMEASLSSMFSCIPGPVLEKLLNLGSIKVRRICQSPSQEMAGRNEEFTTEVSDTEEFDHVLSWTTEKSSAYAILLKLKQDGVDDATILAIEAMIRPMHKSEFLQWYEIQTLFDGSSTLNRFVDAYGSEGFKAVEQAADEIRKAIASNAKPELIQQVFYTAIASIDKKSSLGARYIEPTDKSAYRDGCYNTLKNKRDAVTTSNKKKIIVTEKEVINQLSNEEKAELLPPDSKTYHLYNNDGSIACTLYKYKYKSKTIKIIVTPSWHCIRGHNNTLQGRINNGQSYITFMRSLTNANISSSAALLKQVQIFCAQLIEMEGFGNLEKGTENCTGSVWKAIRNALPKDLCRDPIRAGTASLGKKISPVNGIDSLKVVCLVAVLGIANFTTTMKIGYDIEFPCSDFSANLLTLGRNFQHDTDARLRVAAALKDNETNQRCAILMAQLPKGWLACKIQFCYAIRAPDGKCFSGKEEAKRYAYPQETVQKAAQKAGINGLFSIGDQVINDGIQCKIVKFTAKGRRVKLKGIAGTFTDDISNIKPITEAIKNMNPTNQRLSISSSAVLHQESTQGKSSSSKKKTAKKKTTKTKKKTTKKKEQLVTAPEIIQNTSWYFKWNKKAVLRGPYSSAEMQQCYEAGYVKGREKTSYLSQSETGPFHTLQSYFPSGVVSFK